MSKNLESKFFAFCVVFLLRGCWMGVWFCVSPDGHPPRGMLKPPQSTFIFLKFGHFFALVSLPLDVAVSPHQLGAGCDRERALSIFLAPRIMWDVVFPLPMDAKGVLCREARHATPGSSQAPFPMAKAFQGIFKVPIFDGGAWLALPGTRRLGAGGMLLAEQHPWQVHGGFAHFLPFFAPCW